MPFKLERKRAVSAEVANNEVFVGELLSARPALCSVLLDRYWPDGGVRKTHTLLLFSDAGALKACLRDREAEETAWVTGDGLEGILDALEVGLQEGRLDWRKEGKRKRK